MAEPVDDGSIAEHVAVRLKLLAQMPSDLVRIAERRLGLDPILPRAVHLDRLVEQDVGRLVVFRAQVLLRLVLQAARVEPRLELRLAPSSAGILAGAALRRIHDVCVVHLRELLAQAAVLHAIQFVNHLPELFPRDLPLLEDHEGRQDRRELELAGNPQEAFPVLPHEREAASLRPPSRCSSREWINRSGPLVRIRRCRRTFQRSSATPRIRRTNVGSSTKSARLRSRTTSPSSWTGTAGLPGKSASATSSTDT